MVNKNLILFVFSFVLIISIISVVSAEIIISQPKAIYSAGDELSVEIKLSELKTGYLNVDLICNGANANLYQDIPNSKTISLTRMLTPEYIGPLYGNCFLNVDYDIGNVDSQSFEISKNIDITLQTEEMSYEAGKPIRIKGTAYKTNNILLGQGYNSFVEILMGENISRKDIVKDGQFSVEFLTPENMHAGNYQILINVYDEDAQGNVLNTGNANANVIITQKPARIDLAVGKTQIIPGENITLIPFLYDRAGDQVNEKVLIKITNQNEDSVYEGYIDANQEAYLQTTTNELLGDCKIIATKEAITSEKLVQILELKKINAKIENNTLTIENIGNVPYIGIVQLQIGNQEITQEVSLQLGEKRIYKISAPNGNYDISLKENENLFSLGNIPLTGDAISMKDLGNKIGNIWTGYPLMWFFIGLIAIGLLALWIRKFRKKKKFFSPSNKDAKTLSEIKSKGGFEIVKPNDVSDKILGSEEARRAEQVLTLHGNKQPASIVAIKIKSNLMGIAKANFEKALEYAYKKKAVSYSSGDYVLLIFSPLITKQIRNEETAVKAAIEFDNWLSDHNKRFRNDTIRYGIGVNTGEIVNKMEGKILQFASIDKTIINAKKIADNSNNELLLSRAIHEKTMNNIRADKVTSGAMELFKIKRVVDTEKSKKFIDEFMRRN